jgi:hypothetical protein
LRSLFNIRGFLIGFAICLVPSFIYPLNLWPLLTYESDNETKTVKVLGPFGFWQKSLEGLEGGIRPLFSLKTEGYERIDILYPLGGVEEKEGLRRGYFFPFLNFETHKFFSFFTLYWGKSEEGEAYWGLFPLFGEIKDRFRRDEIDFVLWPLYTRVIDKGTTTYKFLWPFFKLYKGKTEGIDLFPFWGHRVSERGEKGFTLWPFYVWQDEKFMEAQFSLRLYFPFYASLKTPTYESVFLLPPFLHHKHFKEGQKRWEFWPFLAFDDKEQKVFPLFRNKEALNEKSFWFLWPLYTYDYTEVSGTKMQKERFMLIGLMERETFNDEEKVNIFNLWPLFSVSKENDEEEFLFPFLIPLKNEGFKRNWLPILTLISYKSKGPKVDFDMLWGLFHFKKSPEFSYWRIGFLIDRKFTHNTSRLRLLGGLISISKENDTLKLKFFDLF